MHTFFEAIYFWSSVSREKFLVRLICIKYYVFILRHTRITLSSIDFTCIVTLQIRMNAKTGIQMNIWPMMSYYKYLCLHFAIFLIMPLVIIITKYAFLRMFQVFFRFIIIYLQSNLNSRLEWQTNVSVQYKNCGKNLQKNKSIYQNVIN